MKNYDDIGDYPQAIRDAFANFCDHSEERSAEECSDAYLNALKRLNLAIGKWLKTTTYLEFSAGPESLLRAMRNEVRRVRGQEI